MEESKTTSMITDFYLNSTVELKIFEAMDALPFPLYMSRDFQAGLTIVMLMALVAGTRGVEGLEGLVSKPRNSSAADIFY